MISNLACDYDNEPPVQIKCRMWTSILNMDVRTVLYYVRTKSRNRHPKVRISLPVTSKRPIYLFCRCLDLCIQCVSYIRASQTSGYYL